jgi:hypothetical protein
MFNSLTHDVWKLLQICGRNVRKNNGIVFEYMPSSCGAGLVS